MTVLFDFEINKLNLLKIVKLILQLVCTIDHKVNIGSREHVLSHYRILLRVSCCILGVAVTQEGTAENYKKDQHKVFNDH